MIFHFAINQHDAFVHLVQNIIGRSRPNFNESISQKKLAYFFDGRVFKLECFVCDIIADSAIRQKNADNWSELVFPDIVCAANNFVGFGFGYFDIDLAVGAFIKSGANTFNR